MKNNRNILCVVEGEKTELKILAELDNKFIGENFIFFPFGTNIYQVYHRYINEVSEIGEEIDMFIFLKSFDQQGILKDKLKRDFRAIYLFVDLDGHDPLANRYLECLPKMLSIFDNETENGKLYVSYPMVESFNHPIQQAETSEILKGRKYKEHVAKICDTRINQFSNNNLDKAEWSKILIQHVKVINFLVNDNFSYPTLHQDAIQMFSQKLIYENQCVKFITPSMIVVVLSPFAMFLLELLGEPLFEEWQKIAN
jgi:hypothetical protein